MSTKTISLKKEAYDRLRAARRFPAESFSEVVLRATWPEDTIAARGLLDLHKPGLRHFSDEELDRIEALRDGGRGVLTNMEHASGRLSDPRRPLARVSATPARA
jgi:predicted CopG family antitoxin